jgi:uncharacterized Rmd1/YagE family protein
MADRQCAYFLEVRMFVAAEHIAKSIDLKQLGYPKFSSDTAMTETVSGGYLVVFKYGVVVYFGLQTAEKDAHKKEIHSAAKNIHSYQETETATLAQGSDKMTVYDGNISLPSISKEQVLVIADILGKSVILSWYESQVNEMFETIEPIAEKMKKGRILKGKKQLIQTLGGALSIQNAMLSRIRLDDKPDILWDMPELEKLYHLLNSDYEIIERQRVLEGRLKMITDTISFNTDILDYVSSHRVEWYITLLIVVEIVLTLYEMFLRHP